MSVAGVGLFAKKKVSHESEEQLKLENEALVRESFIMDTPRSCWCPIYTANSWQTLISWYILSWNSPPILQEKEFAWLLETEYYGKLSAMDKCMEVGR